ncbi:nucleotide sugar dehydrogenase [Candidatus Pelagibacter sp.]|nr:nucleotide sugar dehydrogenase [Candidatus Pelagibacter sp.]
MIIKKIIKDIRSKKAKIGIIGLGYVGLPLAILFAKKDFRVIGFDTDKKKIQALNKKKSYIDRISSSQVKQIFKKGFCTYDFSHITECDCIIICVPTPLKKNQPDLSFIKYTITSILKYLKKEQLIILESTSYPGTTRELVVNKVSKIFDIGKNFYIGFSSERINPGINENSLHQIPKVISGSSKMCLKVISELYKKVFNKVVLSNSLEIAEFSKLLENIYRSVNIGFMNEMKFIADKMNLDIFEILKIAKTKPYGFNAFDPGPGVGGHCIPIDPEYLYWKSKKLGIEAKFIKLSAQTNHNVTSFIITKIKKLVKDSYSNKKKIKILILGVTYKKNVDDLRESSGIKLIKNLKKNNYVIDFSDPYVAKKILVRDFKTNRLGINITPNKLKTYDITILMTDHDKFDYRMIYRYSKKIIDCRGKYPVDHKVIRA